MVINESEPVIMVMRPYQIYAVKESIERILGSNLNGFVFHTTGSGKTLTSYKLASLLRDNPLIDKAFFLIDRKDLFLDGIEIQGVCHYCYYDDEQERRVEISE